MIGRAAGALAGNVIDRSLISGLTTIEGSRLANARIAGAEVTAWLWNVDFEYWEVSSVVSTNAQGEYALANLPDGDYKLQFQTGTSVTRYLETWFHAKSSLEDADIQTISEGSTLAYNAVLEPGYSVTGRVTNALRANLSGIDVTASLYDGESDDYTDVASVQTDNSGMYEFPALRPGAYLIEFASPSDADVQYQSGYYGGARSPDDATPLIISSANKTGIDIELTATNTISGVVKDTPAGKAAARPLEGIVVR
eukprot:gene5780-7176_t